MLPIIIVQELRGQEVDESWYFMVGAIIFGPYFVLGWLSSRSEDIKSMTNESLYAGRFQD